MDDVENPGVGGSNMSATGAEDTKNLASQAPSLDIAEMPNPATPVENSPAAVVEGEVMSAGDVQSTVDAGSAQAAPTPSLKSGSGQPVLAMSKIQSLRVKVQAVLGTVPLKISELASIEKGDLLELDTNIGDPISIYANGDLIAKAEIVVTPDDPPRFGLTITEVVSGEASVA